MSFFVHQFILFYTDSEYEDFNITNKRVCLSIITTDDHTMYGNFQRVSSRIQTAGQNINEEALPVRCDFSSHVYLPSMFISLLQFLIFLISLI